MYFPPFLTLCDKCVKQVSFSPEHVNVWVCVVGLFEKQTDFRFSGTNELNNTQKLRIGLFWRHTRTCTSRTQLSPRTGSGSGRVVALVLCRRASPAAAAGRRRVQVWLFNRGLVASFRPETGSGAHEVARNAKPKLLVDLQNISASPDGTSPTRRFTVSTFHLMPLSLGFCRARPSLSAVSRADESLTLINAGDE